MTGNSTPRALGPKKDLEEPSGPATARAVESGSKGKRLGGGALRWVCSLAHSTLPFDLPFADHETIFPESLGDRV